MKNGAEKTAENQEINSVEIITKMYGLQKKKYFFFIWIRFNIISFQNSVGRGGDDRKRRDRRKKDSFKPIPEEVKILITIL